MSHPFGVFADLADEASGYRVKFDYENCTMDVVQVDKVIRKEGSEWVLYSHDGKKVLGRHKSKKKAQAQERAIQARKHGG